MRYLTPSGHVVLLDDDVTLPGRVSIGGHGYPQIWCPARAKVMLLHRWLLGLEIGDPLMGDHINRNKLDCRRENLRVVTPTVSNLNRAIAKRDLPRNVYLTENGTYNVSVKRHRKVTNVGHYSTVQKAVEARDKYLAGLPEWEGVAHDV